MKQILILLALCLTIIASCVKEQAIPKSLTSETMSRIIFMDDFYVSKNVKPYFHKIDSGATVIVFSDSVYNNFGGSLKRICFQFSNPNINYSHLKLTVASTTGGQYKSYTASATTMNNGVKQLVFDNLGTSLLISPGWSTIVLKATVSGIRGSSFSVTIPQDGISYHSINDQAGAVVGLPLTTDGLKIR